MILRIKAKGPGKLSVSSRNADLWQRVALVGSPLGSPGVCLLGTVAGISSAKGTILLDARVTYGVSGAAVVALDGRDAGKIIGVLFRVWGNSHMHMGIAVNAENVRYFLIMSGVLL
jgi:S1-C subfamily serine protease